MSTMESQSAAVAIRSVTSAVLSTPPREVQREAEQEDVAKRLYQVVAERDGVGVCVVAHEVGKVVDSVHHQECGEEDEEHPRRLDLDSRADVERGQGDADYHGCVEEVEVGIDIQTDTVDWALALYSGVRI